MNEGSAQMNGSGFASGGTQFYSTASAGNSILHMEAAPVGEFGGFVSFQDTADGGTARTIIEGGAGLSPGKFDIGYLASAGMNIGSIEGGGNVALGSKGLTVGGNNAVTEFSGVIRDGGSLGVVGAGALTLSGSNTYTGETTIGDGLNADSGKLIAGNLAGSATGTGPVTVRRGGTLSGDGFIAGPVTLQAGGIIAPGDPVTLTLEDSLLWDGDSIIRLALGPDQAGSDLLQINGALTKGAAGTFTFDLVDFGAIVGQSYELIRFGSQQGFTASDFTFNGVQGNFSANADSIAFHVTGVPEPGVIGLLVPVLLFFIGVRRRPGLRVKHLS